MKSFLTLVCCLTLSCASAQLMRYEHEKVYFEYPGETWKVIENQQMATSVVLMRTATDTIFTDNINLLILDLSGTADFTLSSYMELSMSQIVATYGENSIEENVLVDEANPPYYKLIYAGQMGIAVWKFEQFVWFRDGIAYIFTFTTSEKRFDQQKEEVEQILGSLKFKD